MKKDEMIDEKFLDAIKPLDITDAFNDITKLSYEVDDCYDCNNLRFSKGCYSCLDSAFLLDCRGCTHCLGCINLRNKSNYIFNCALHRVVSI